LFEVIIASIGYAGGVVADKLVLSKYRVPVKRFIPLIFVWLSIVTAVFLSRWGHIDYELMKTTRYIILFVTMIAVACTWNVLYSEGIQKEDLHEFELIMLLSPLATIMLATIFLPAERDWGIFVPGVIASSALIATRFRKHHVTIGRTAWRTILAMLLISIESIIIKELLAVMSPVALYFVRTATIAIVFVILYRPKLFALPGMAYALTIVSAIFGVVQMVLKFYGFQNLGVTETMMILVLGPFLVYGASAIIMKEKIFKRDIFAALVVVLCILYVEFWR